LAGVWLKTGSEGFTFGLLSIGPGSSLGVHHRFPFFPSFDLSFHHFWFIQLGLPHSKKEHGKLDQGPVGILPLGFKVHFGTKLLELP